MASIVDGKNNEADISNLFADKYSSLYNSVSYDNKEMSALIDTLNNEIENKCCTNNCCSHDISVSDVTKCVDKLKKGKHDGVSSFYSDNIKYGSHKLYVYFSLLFNALIHHCTIPDGMCLSTLVPLIKNKRQSASSSDNYRAIALSSTVGKLLDNIILYKFSDVLHASDLQFGFKKGHSTAMCTFAVNEVIQYYINQNTPVYLTLLDASKAFDCVHYVKMFNILRDKGLCPLYCKFLCLLYTNQIAQVKWNTTFSDRFQVTNGVKQGGVLSPIIFSAYMDILLEKLRSTNVGCYIGHKYCGSFAYADDISLLNPSTYATNKMLQVCNDFSKEYNILFNVNKTKLLVFNSYHNVNPVIIFNNLPITVSICEKLLGTYVGEGSNKCNITSYIREFNCTVNYLYSVFHNTSQDIVYKLFKSYCMSLFNVVLWDFNSKEMSVFYTSWRKALRKLLSLPMVCHSHLLHLIVDDIPVDLQIYKRFIKFINNVKDSKNTVIQLLGKIAIYGSGSIVSNNILYVCSILNLNINSEQLDTSMFCVSNDQDVSVNDNIIVSIIKDMLLMKNYNRSYFSTEQINDILLYVCTS